jgi:hypothetical protein
MMQAPPTNALAGKMQQRLIAVPFSWSGSLQSAEDLFEAGVEQITSGQQVGLEPRFGVAACLRAFDQDRGRRSDHGQIAIL